MPAKKQITRDMILSAALELLKGGGMGAVNVKPLARRLDCSTQPIYLSFDNMDALRRELSSLAALEFLQRLNRDGGETDLYGMAYIRFAQEEKQLFRFLFMRQDAYAELREALLPIMQSSISRLMEQYQISYDEAHYFHDQLWVHTHGIAAMIATGFCDWNMDKVQKMLAECGRYLSRKYGEQNVQQ